MRRDSGTTVVELMIYVGIASWIGLAVSKYAMMPFKINQLQQNALTEQMGYTATNIPADDFKCALGTSIQWPYLDPNSAVYTPSVNIQIMPWFRINDPAVGAFGPPVSYVCYRYNAVNGELIREYIPGQGPTASSINGCSPVAGDNSRQMLIVKNVLPPTAAAPLFKRDPAAWNTIVMTLRFKRVDNKETTVVRRIHVRS